MVILPKKKQVRSRVAAQYNFTITAYRYFQTIKNITKNKKLLKTKNSATKVVVLINLDYQKTTLLAKENKKLLQKFINLQKILKIIFQIDCRKIK